MLRTIRTITAALFVAAATALAPAHAGNLTDNFSVKGGVILTEHIQHCETCNEIHPMIGIEYEINDNHSIVGGFMLQNSKGNVSPLIGYEYDMNAPFYVGVGLALSGYEHLNQDLLPNGMAIIPRFGVELIDEDENDFGLRIFVSPNPTEKEPLRSVVGVEIGF